MAYQDFPKGKKEWARFPVIWEAIEDQRAPGGGNPSILTPGGTPGVGGAPVENSSCWVGRDNCWVGSYSEG